MLLAGGIRQCAARSNDKIGGSSGLPITLIHHVTLSIRIQP